MYNVIHTKDVFTVLCSSLVSKPTLDKERPAKHRVPFLTAGALGVNKSHT